MSNKKISELINAVDVSDNDVFPMVQNSVTKKIKWEDIRKTMNVSDIYDSTHTYNIGDFCIYQNQLYKCNATTTGEFDSTKWDATNITTELNSRLEFEIVDSW